MLKAIGALVTTMARPAKEGSVPPHGSATGAARMATPAGDITISAEPVAALKELNLLQRRRSAEAPDSAARHLHFL